MRHMTSCSAATSLAPSFTNSAYANEVAVALKAVRSAAFLTTGVQKGLKQSQETSQKADDSPVTVADYAAQAVVSWRVDLSRILHFCMCSLTLSPVPQACTHVRSGSSSYRHLRSAFPDALLVAEEDSKALREESGKAMRARVTELVNSALAQDGTHALAAFYVSAFCRIPDLVRGRFANLFDTVGRPAGAGPLSEAEVLACIDHGGSQGGRKGAAGR